MNNILTDIRIMAFRYKLPSQFKVLEISPTHQKKMLTGVLSPDKNSPFYPSRSDEKIMRTDVVSAIIGILEMLHELKITTSERNKMALFVANSIFIEENNKNLNRALGVLNKLEEYITDKQKLQAIYKNTPPLLALETLTNATMSFISKYSKIKGQNTTFGSTSHAAFEALEEAIYQVKSKKKKVLVGGSNCSGLYSFLAYQNFYKDTTAWKESAGASFMILGNEGKIKISKIQHNYKLPSLGEQIITRNWKHFFKNNPPDFIVYSGGYTTEVFSENEKEIKQICSNYYTWEKEYGNLGSAAIFMNLAYGSELIEKGITQTVDILNRDVYGREAHIRLEKATD